ncbi:MAG: hypothetical protein ABL986_20175 [Vicinamibacterales bacterium]
MSGSTIITISADRAWNRNTRQMTVTTTACWISVFFRVLTEPRISSDRSYVGMRRTPSGRRSVAISDSSAWITCSAFEPMRITTIPPTASPVPFQSAAPRRIDSDVRVC